MPPLFELVRAALSARATDASQAATVVLPHRDSHTGQRRQQTRWISGSQSLDVCSIYEVVTNKVHGAVWAGAFAAPDADVFFILLVHVAGGRP
eukprot:593362-Prymnesium_polylepis.1